MAELNNSGSGQWSETDASNISAPPDGAPSGTLPSQAEGIWRAIMGALKRFWDRINGTVTTSGSAGAYVYTPSNGGFPSAYVTGENYSWIANFASLGNDTLNVNALGAKPIYKPTASGMTKIAAGDIQSGQMVKTAYDAALNAAAGGFHLLSPIANGSTGNVAGPGSSTANDIPKFADTTGKVLADGYSVGTGASNIPQRDGSGNLAATTAASAGIPQNSQSANYTAVLGDANSHLYHPSADTTARTFTIPANASVAYPIGTTLTFVNDSSAGTLTIALTTDTLVLMGAGSTGSRTLAANGLATALKVTSTRWVISGTNLT